MINLRYHIVSLTAVFLAIGIGLTLGTTFLDRATVDSLEAQLDDVEVEVAATNEENAELRSDIEDFERRSSELREALPERLLAEHLTDVPVLVLATEGTPSELVDEAVNSMSAAGADVAGTWWLTERWSLDDDDELSDLAGVLDVRTRDAARLRRIAAVRMAAVMDGATDDPTESEDPATTTTSTIAGGVVPEGPDEVTDLPPTTVAAPVEASEPELIGALQRAGFIDYETLDSAAESEGVLLPGEAVRFVIISALPEGAGPQVFATALVADLAASGPVPVLAAQAEVELPESDTDPAEGAERSTFVGDIRATERTRERISTLDHLDTPSGLAALVLAVDDLGEPLIGHYGVAPAASRLLPGPTPVS